MKLVAMWTVLGVEGSCRRLRYPITHILTHCLQPQRLRTHSTRTSHVDRKCYWPGNAAASCSVGYYIPSCMPHHPWAWTVCLQSIKILLARDWGDARDF
ncbi:hypothetical protein K458DRAFT_423359 [Lentithecium fluviatile CBS 122367]|uniref:Uncharacterized protein n=1 Tax=Lentithecium fluviatile CBS 122367 TaxID=1168545 RepID=A0A6G1IJK9_9PLEO|nr:hypothetical protein K458DRAFT_423359 [Lentithecium fluviatile CBS 122367]